MLENYKAKEITIGSRLKAKIESVDSTLSELAEQLGCTREHIEQICADKVSMTPHELMQAAEALGTSTEYLSLESDSDLPQEYVDWGKEYAQSHRWQTA